MSVSYEKFWRLLIDKDVNKTDLRQAIGLSSVTVAKMTIGKDVGTFILKRICEVAMLISGRCNYVPVH